MTRLAPFCTFLTPSPDLNPGELQAEIARLYERQKAIDAMVHGELDAETLLDLLEDHGIDPEQWIETSIANIEYIMTNNL